MQERTNDTALSVTNANELEQAVLESRARAAFACKRIPKRYRLKPVRSMGTPRPVWRKGHRHALRHDVLKPGVCSKCGRATCYVCRGGTDSNGAHDKQERFCAPKVKTR